MGVRLQIFNGDLRDFLRHRFATFVSHRLPSLENFPRLSQRHPFSDGRAGHNAAVWRAGYIGWLSGAFLPGTAFCSRPPAGKVHYTYFTARQAERGQIKPLPMGPQSHRAQWARRALHGQHPAADRAFIGAVPHGSLHFGK